MSSESRELNRARNQLRSSRAPAQTLHEIREQLPAEYFEYLINWIRDTPTLRRRLPFPRRATDFRTIKPDTSFQPTTLDRELQWASAVLRPHRSTVRAFQSARQAFERALLTDNLKDADDCLKQVDSALGPSLWLIKSRLLLTQQSLGLSAQKQWADQVINSVKHGSITAFITHHNSVRNEPGQSISRFYNRVRNAFIAPRIPQPLRAYLLFHTAPDLDLVPEAASLLSNQLDGTIVDYVDTLSFALHCLCIEHSVELTAVRRNWLFTTLLEVNEFSPYSSATQDLIEGRTESAYALAMEELRHTPDDPQPMRLATLASACQTTPAPVPETPLWCRMLGLRTTILAGDAPMTDAIAELAKIAQPQIGRPWANDCLATIEYATAKDPLRRRPTSLRLLALGGLTSTSSLRFLSHTTESSRFVLTHSSAPLSEAEARMFTDQPSKLLSHLGDHTAALEHFQDQRFEQAIAIARTLRRADRPRFFQREGLRL